VEQQRFIAVLSDRAAGKGGQQIKEHGAVCSFKNLARQR